MIITPSHRFKSFQIPWVLVFRFIYYFQTSSTRSNFAFAKLILRINPDLTVVHKYKNTHLPVSFISVAVFSRYFFQPLLWTEDLSYSESSSCLSNASEGPFINPPAPSPVGQECTVCIRCISWLPFHFFIFFGGGGRVITIWNNKINNKNTGKLLHWTWDVRKLRGLLGTRIRMMVSASTHRFCILFAGCEKHTSSYW